MAEEQFANLRNWKANPKSGEIQKFDITAKMTAAESDENKTVQHKVPGPSHDDLGAKANMNG